MFFPCDPDTAAVPGPDPPSQVPPTRGGAGHGPVWGCCAGHPHRASRARFFFWAAFRLGRSPWRIPRLRFHPRVSRRGPEHWNFRQILQPDIQIFLKKNKVISGDFSNFPQLVSLEPNIQIFLKKQGNCWRFFKFPFLKKQGNCWRFFKFPLKLFGGRWPSF